MLKIRIIPTILYREPTLVKGVRFDSRRRVGAAAQAIRVYGIREVDELIFLDVSATPDGRSPDVALIDDLADECFMPLTVGGGVGQLSHIEALLSAGADKVAINTAAHKTPELIEQAARRFGSQCIIVSIDARPDPRRNGQYEVVTCCGTVATGTDALSFADECEARGAGEIIVTAIDRDGTLSGYDLALIKGISNCVSIPVIASGGAGEPKHFVEALESGAAALAAASIFHFTHVTPKDVKRCLRASGYPVRL